MFTARLIHSSISDDRTVSDATLQVCKDKADVEFGEGFLDHEIVIFDEAYTMPMAVASRRVGDKDWQ